MCRQFVQPRMNPKTLHELGKTGWTSQAPQWISQETMFAWRNAVHSVPDSSHPCPSSKQVRDSVQCVPARRGAKRCDAFLMIDCLLYIALLSVITGFAFAAFYKCMDIHRDLNRNATDIVRALKAGERWRSDIRESIAAPQFLKEGDFAALEVPKSSGVVVYLFSNGSVWRQENLQAPWKEFLSGIKASRMERSPRERVVAWTWELELRSRKQIVRMPPLFSFVAVSPKDRNP